MSLVAHVEIPVTDLERALRFHASMFGDSEGDRISIQPA